MLLFIYYFFFVELLIIAYFDLRTRKISNWWSLLNCFIVLSFFIFLPHYYPFAWNSFSYSFIFLGVGFILFLVKIMGAGDTKFLFSFFLVTPFFWHDRLFFFLLISTLIMGSSVLLYHIIKNIKELTEGVLSGNIAIIKQCFGSKFPFSPVILLSWFLLGWEKVFF